MEFSVTCTAIKEFDPQSQAYKKCGQKLKVDSSQVGSLVQCPSCGSDVEVINPDSMGINPLDGADDAVQTQQHQPDILHNPVPSASAPAPSAAVPTPSGAQTPIQNVAVTGATPAAQGTSSGNRVENADGTLRKDSMFEASSVLQPARFGRETSCHHCGNLLEDGQAVCPSCDTPRRAAYVDPKDRKILKSRGPFGFQLWMDQLVNRSESGNPAFTYLCYFLSAVLVGIGGFLLIAGHMIAKPVGLILIFSGLVLAGSLYFYERLRKNPKLKLPIPVAFTWNIALMMCRRLRFSSYKESQTLDRRNSDFGDHDLSKIRDLNKMKVVDLEGTQITDAGLLHLYNIRGLHYVVLKDTNISLEAVHELQVTIPRTWIWY